MPGSGWASEIEAAMLIGAVTDTKLGLTVAVSRDGSTVVAGAINFSPDPDDCIEYTALINIRPAQGNRGMLIADDAIRGRVREITFALIGRGEPLT